MISRSNLTKETEVITKNLTKDTNVIKNNLTKDADKVAKGCKEEYGSRISPSIPS